MTAAAERITAHARTTGVESSSTVCVILLLLLRIGEDLVCRLDFAELVLRIRIFIGIRVELLGQTVVCFLDVGRRRILVNS